MKLFKVTINMPVSFVNYYVAADGFDEAAELAMEADQSDGAHNGGVDMVEVIGSFGDDESENLLLSDRAAYRAKSFLE